MDEGDNVGICFIVQLIEHLPEPASSDRRRTGRHLLHVQLSEHVPGTVLMGRKRQGIHLLHSSVDRAFTRDCLVWTKETVKSDICFIVQLIEHSPEIS